MKRHMTGREGDSGTMRSFIHSCKRNWEQYTRICLGIAITATLIGCQAADSSRGKMLSLSDGKTLTGWHPVGGGKWTVEDGVIVGRAEKARLYGLLVSDKVFKNFIVKFKFKCLAGDSGFYIRTIIEKPDKARGLQVQVGRAGSGAGGIYESYGRKWLDKPTADEEKKILNTDSWNRMTISARDGDIVVHVNDVRTAELKDDPGRPKGHFALQMHSGNIMHIMFRDIQVQELPD